MGTTRKFLRNMDKVTMSNLGKATKLQKVVSAVTAMGFVLQPVAAMAQIVTDIKPVGNGATVESAGNVTNIWAGTVVNDVALNVFKKFDIGANDIANMYFHEKNGSTEANNLVNMVGSKININGTVNAIKNSKIGGNLYFLSSNGVAVGAGGVVNAGTLTLMTPSDRFMKTAMAAAGTDGVLTDATNAVINIFDDNYKVDVDTFKNSYLLNNWDKFQKMEVAMNKTGTITVNGTINTINGIRMKAAHINIGKELDENGKLKNAAVKAVMNSGIVDFGDLVNIKGDGTRTAVNAGLGNNLTATVSGNGDIVLAAVANTVNTKDDYGNFMSQNVQGYNSVQATVDVGNAEIKAEKGTIDISAIAKTGDGDGHLLGVDLNSINTAEILGGKIAKTDAQINIDGTLTADTINIAANAENSYDEESATNVDTLKNYVKDIGLGLVPAVGDAQDALGLDVDVSYAKLASNAEVKIGENANLTATGNAQLEAEPNDDNEDSGWRQGGALNISAISKLEANVGAEVESEGNEEAGNQGKAAGGATGTNKKKNNNTLAKVMPNAGIAIVDTDNTATVTVKGTLSAANGDANVSASAVNSVEAASGVTAVADKETGAESNYINAAVTIADITNASKVEITGTTTVGGELNALAKSSSEVTTGASAGSDKNALLNSAINVTDASSTADLVIGGTLTADNMNIAAENTISNEMQATNKLGESKREVRSKMGQGTLNKIFGNAGKKVKKGDKVDNIGKYFSIGAAVNVVDETNRATVTVKRGASLTATGAAEVDENGKAIPTINISANNTIEDSFMSATSVINNYTGGKGNTSSSGNVSTGTSSNTAAMASAAVLSADMDNSAQVIIEGSDDTASAPVIKGAHVNINANSAFEYDRLGSMIEGLKDDWNDIYEKYKEIPELGKTLLNAMNASGNYLAHPSVDGAMDAAGAFSDVVEAISLKYVDTAMGVPDDLQTLMDDLTAFAEVSNYTNFYTAASTAGGNATGKAGGSGAGSGQAKVAATGSINLNSIKNNAQVIVGKNAKIDASVTDVNNKEIKGNLNISATAKQHDVALNGKTKYFIPKVSNTSGATAIGGSVGVHDADVNSLVVIGEGAKLSGNDVSLSAENDLQHTAITFGGGAATNDGITGMFAYMEGQSNSIISVDDEASINAANKLALNANNDTTISNIIFDRTSAGNSAIGASIGIIDYGVNNIAAIADNDSDATRGDDEEVKELVGLVQGQLGNDEKAQLGTSTNKTSKGKIEVNAVEINAATTGTITGVSVAGTTAGASQSNKRGTGSGFKIPAKISGAGSASVNEISGNTAALLEGVDVTTTGTNGDVKVSASDDSMIGAYSGAAALKKKGRQASSGGFSATLAGAVAYNNINTGVTAQIKDASIKNAAKITNIAAREGAVVAAGLALGVDTSGQGAGSASSINAGVSASINEINNSTHAVMNNVTTSTSGGDGQVPANTDIDNIAQSKDIQVAGGITAQYAKGGGIGIGAAVSSLHATNDIQSKITGSTLKNVGTLKAYAASDLVQVGTAISAGVIQGQNGNGVQAAVADNQLTNNVGVTISGGEIAANNIAAKAFDGVIEAKTTHLTDLSTEGFDVDGADAMADVNGKSEDGNTNGANVSVNKEQLGQSKKDDAGNEQGDDGKTVSDFTADGNSGNLIVSGAASIIANTSTQGTTVTAGAAAVNQTINNNFTVDIKNAKITAETVQAKAESDTLMVGVAAGVAVSTGQQGAANLAGSVGVMQLNNNTKTTIENSEITAKTIKAKAETKSRLINVAGLVSASKGKVAAGLATATNILNNTTGAYVYGSTIKGKDGNEDTSLTVEADNNSKAYAVAVGVAAQVGQQGAALSGDVAVNKGKNNTEAIVGKRENGKGNTITNVDDININVLGNTTLNAISGGVTASTGNAGLGGAVAYNEVGNGDNDKQNTIAKLTDTVITTDKATTIDVNAVDSSHMLAFAVGAAVQTGQTGAAAQGSAATSILHKNVEAAVSNVNIDEHKDGETDRYNAALNVTAQNTSEAITSADVMAISTANFAGGAAVAVTNSDNDTKASITGGNKNLKSGKVQAESNVDIINIGISAAVATGQGGSIAGNVAVNNIKNDTIASIDNATMNATGTIGVLANSKEHIRNYAGALAATVGQGYAAGGLSTAVNVISGNTKATVTGSTIAAGGDDAGISVKEYYKDDNDKKYKDKDETLTGFVVNADSAHEIDNVVVTGGVAATAEFAVAGTGTVTVNTIKGETEASVTGTDVNATGAVGDKANVSVRANDNTEIDSHVGSASIAASANGGVGVGIASDSNVMSRKVTAKIAGDNAKKTVNANKLTVNAFNKHDITTSTTGVAVGAGAYAGVGVAGTISVVKTDAETNATVENIEGKNNGFTVNADHVNKLLAISNSAALGGAVGGASIGAGVSIVQDGSKTQAALKGSNLDHYQDNAQDSVTAHNDTDLTSSTASGAASISIGAGVSDVITINNIDNTVQTTVANSNIGSTKQAGRITVDATNDLKTKFVAVSAAGGLVSVGMGIGVNTIDTSVVTNVTGGSMKAGTVEITANENRDIDQTAVSAGVGGVAGSATVMVTNIGSQVSDKYGLTSAETVDQNGNATTTETKAKEVDISGAFSKANESAAAQDKLFTNKDDSTGINSNGILVDAGTTGLDMGTGLTSADYKTGVQANKGGDTVVDKNGKKLDVQGVKVNVNNADITASGSATIKANAKTDADITVGNAAAGTASVGSTVGVLDVKRNSGVNITGGNISANNLTVGSDQSGTARVDVYQAAASGANFGLFYSGVHLSGNNDINIKGAQLSGANGVAITTNDTTTASLQTIGGSFALTENANIFVVNGKNESSSTIMVDSEGENKKNSEIKAENGDVMITAKHGRDIPDASSATGNAKDNLDKATNAYNSAVAAYDSAKSAYDSASDSDKASKMETLQAARNNLTEAEFNLQKAQQQAKIAAATEKATMTAKITPVAVAGVASGLGFNAKVEDSSQINVNIGASQKFAANKTDGKVDIKAINNSVNKVSSVTVNAALGAAIGATGVQAKGNAGSSLTVGNNNVFAANNVNLGAEANVVNDAKITAVGAGFGSFMVNWATASAATDVNVNVDDNLYKATNVNISGKSDITQHAGATGLIAGMYTSGTNLAKVDAHDVVNVTACGNQAESNDNTSQNSVKITAEGVVNQLADSNGYGGAYVDVSPAAAITKSNINSATTANVTGNWKVDTIDVNAKHDNVVDLDTDAVKAAVVGLSGVWAYNDIVNNTNLNLTNAVITANSNVNAKALNDISYRNKIWAGGYGAVAGNALIADDDIMLNAKVNVGDEQDAAKKATITSKTGAINIAALTDGGMHNKTGRPLATIKKEVVIKSAGVVAGSLAFSSDDVNINNTINVNANSKLATEGSANNTAANNITLSTADRMNYIDEATADTQGGVVGAASTDMDVTMNRANTIKIAGTVDSNYDAIFDAGDSSVLNMVLKSNAYNKTAAPLVANPALDYSLNQTNSINLQQGSSVKSTRDIELAATTGNTTLATQSQSWKWTDGGLTGNASLASTADGNGTRVGNSNNTVTVDGTVVAGKNNELTITIKDADKGAENLEAEVKKYDDKKGTIPKAEQDKLDTAQNAYDSAVDASDNKAQEIAKANQELSDLENALVNRKAQDAGLKSAMDTAFKEKNVADNELASAKTALVNVESALDNKITEIYKKYNSDNDNVTVENMKQWISEDLNSTNPKFTDTDLKSSYDTCNKAVADATNTRDACNKTANEKATAYEAAKKAYDDNRSAITNTPQLKQKLQNDINTKKTELDSLKKIEQEKLDDLNSVKDNYAELEEQASGATAINPWVFGDGDNIGKNKDGSKTYVTIEASPWYEQSNGNAAKNVELQNYAVRLTNKIAELQEMIKAYAGTDVEKDYQTELQHVQADLVALGLGYVENGVYHIAEGESTVPTVELKNITVTGGNVNIKGDKLNGAGTVTAHGDPNVTINNESSFYLKVNDIIIDGEGGKVTFNNTSAKSQNGGPTIEAKQANVVDSATGNNATITINSTTNTTSTTRLHADDPDSAYFTPDIGIFGNIYNPYGTISINNDKNSIYVDGEGSIKGRSVSLVAGGSVVQGYTDGIRNVGSDPGAAVSSDVIEKIQAAITNAIAYNGKALNQSGKYYTAFATEDDLAKFLFYAGIGNDYNAALQIAKTLRGSNQDKTKGIAAAGAVYINAANINVNGTIQSGIEKYTLSLNDDAFNTTKRYDTNNVLLSDNKYYRNDDYKVSKNDDIYYADGQFVSGVKAWYNPVTNEIFTDDIEQSGGGRIYLTGKISNTNASASGGKLVALDGGSTITINSSAKDYNLSVGKINADNIKGEIKITDMMKKNSNGNAVVTTYTRDADGNVLVNGEAGEAKYNPNSQTYQFTSGETSETIEYWKHVRDSSWWGLKVDKKQAITDMKNDGAQTTKTETKDGAQISRSEVINDGSIGSDYANINVRGSDGTTNFNNVQIKNTIDNVGNSNSIAKGSIYQITVDRKVSDESVPSEIVTTTKKKGLTGLWGKKVTRTWTESRGTKSAYNYGIKADNPIEIGFIGNKSGSTVNITGAKDITLAGDIRAGSVNVTANNGSIVTAGFDSAIANQQKTIYTDNLNLTATNGNIKVLQQGVDKALNLKASAGQNIDIKTLAGIKTGDVYIDNVNAAGNINLSIEGKVLSGARDANISGYAARNANTANINARGTLMINAAGGIGSENNWMTVDVGSYGEYSATNGNIYMKQAGDGVMRLKQVIANDGDVFLEAKGGFVDAIADNTVTTSNENAAIADWKKLGLLGNAGVTEGLQNDKASQVTNLKNQADNLQSFGRGENNALIGKGDALVQAVESQYNDFTAKQSAMYAAQGNLNEAVSALNKSNTEATKSAYNAALAAYNKAFGEYAQAKNTYETAKQNWISDNIGSLTTDASLIKKAEGWLNSYETVQHSASSAHQWTARELMYAVQDSVINPKAGTITDVAKANVVGNNITLKTDGSFGVKDTQKTEIKIADMFKYNADGTLASDATSEANLKQLAAARADDVTWGTDTIVIERTTPVTVQLNKKADGTYGNVKLETITDGNGMKNIYLIGKDSALNLNDVIASGDVRLLAHEGIYSNNTNGDLNIVGKDISLEGGRGNIGSATQAILVGLLGGKINANALGDIYLKQMTANPAGVSGTLNTDMVLGSLAGKNITVDASKNIISGIDKIYDKDGNLSEANSVSYINVSDTLTLKTTAGSVGTDTNGLRIKNSGGVVDIDAANGAYLEAKGDGTLVLGTIKTGNGSFNVNSEGNLTMQRAEEKDAEGNIIKSAVTGSINAGKAAQNINLTAADDIKLNGKVNAEGKNLQVTSYAGDITQVTSADSDNIVADKAILSAVQGSIELDNAKNKINNLQILTLGKDFTLNVNQENLNLSVDNVVNNYGGNFTVNNSGGAISVTNVNANIYGDISLSAKGNISIDDKSKFATNELNSTTSNAAVLKNTGNITLTAGAFDGTEGSIANNGSIMANAATGKDTAGNLISGMANVTLNATKGNIENNGTITATASDVKDAEGNIIQAGQANITLNAKSVTNQNALNAKTDIDIDATNGDVENSGTFEAGNNIDIYAIAVNITNNGTAKAGQNVDLNASGNVTTSANGTIISGNDTKLNAGTTIEVNGTINAEGNIEATTTNGDVTINNTVESGKDTNINAGTNSSVNINNTIKSGANTNLTANGTGVINITKNITAGGSISGTTTNGSITVGEDAPLMANNGSIKLTTNNASDVTAGTITVNGKLTTNNTDGVVGNIELTTDHGYITVNAESEIKNAGSLITKVGVGNVKFTDKANTNINNGSLENNVTKGSVENNANVTIENGNAKNTVENGNITINGATNITTGDVINKVTEGNVSFKGVTSVGNGNISTTVDNGNIDYNAETNVNTGNIYTEAKNGNIGHNANMTVGAGNITDKASGAINAKDKGKGDVALKAINGSIDIDAGGDINLAEVIAANGTADFNSANGSIYLRKVNGKNVILIAKKNILTDETYADNITTNGDNITLSISQDTGLLIDELLANTITINKAKGSLDIEKMAVTNRADFNVNGMKTTVWGKEAPERVDSDSIYWFNVNDWHRGGYWMNLIFSEKQNVQRSNGLLLQLRDYHYVYNQRFTAVNHLHQLLAENKADEYDINFNPEVVHYFRHDLYDLDEREQQLEEHADPAKIVVEA